MIDWLRLRIPFRQEWVVGGERFATTLEGLEAGHCGYLTGHSRLDIPLAARCVTFSGDRYAFAWPEDGMGPPSPSVQPSSHHDAFSVSDLYHPWESVPSSFTGLAFKCFNGGDCWPVVEIKASPAKLLQGHNVFGPTDLALCARQLLAVLAQNARFSCCCPSIPELFAEDRRGTRRTASEKACF